MMRLLSALLCLCSLPAAAQTVQHPFTFTHVPTGLPSFRGAVADWADVDGDGDLDLFVSGYERLDDKGHYAVRAHLYRYAGVIIDPQVPGQQRPDLRDLPNAILPVAFGDAAWGDYDRDGDLDLVVLGSTTAAPPYVASTTLYRNDDGTLTPTSVVLPALHSGQVAWGDFEGDGDLDLLLTGTASASTPYAGEIHLMRNTDGAFSEIQSALPPLAFGTITWRDFSGDGRPDVYLSGLTPTGILTQRWTYRDGDFVKETETPGVLMGRSAVASNAGAPRFALTGALPGPFYLSGQTRLSLNAAVPGLFGGAVDWGDLDGDGDLDFSLSGTSRPYRSGEHIVFRDEDGALRAQNLLLGTVSGPLRFLDYDGDGDLDLFAAGETTALYRNDRPRPADVPTMPSGLVAEVGDGRVTLRWDATGGPTTHDVWVGTAPDRADIVAPPFHLTSGHRLMAAPGAVEGSEMTLTLPAGRYFWGVQRISAERVGSVPAVGPMFSLTATSADESPRPTAFALETPRPSPFSQQTTLRYHLPQSERVRLTVYDATGRLVRTLVAGTQPAGAHQVTWEGRDDDGLPMASGLYLCRIEAGAFLATRTLFLVR